MPDPDRSDLPNPKKWDEEDDDDGPEPMDLSEGRKATTSREPTPEHQSPDVTLKSPADEREQATQGRTAVEERFRERGLLPQCELPVSGSDRYYPGAENVAGAVASGEVTHPGTDETFYISGPDSLAKFVMDSWMTSPPHRDVMTLPAIDQVGVGVGRNDEDLFVAVEFC